MIEKIKKYLEGSTGKIIFIVMLPIIVNLATLAGSVVKLSDEFNKIIVNIVSNEVKKIIVTQLNDVRSRIMLLTVSIDKLEKEGKPVPDLLIIERESLNDQLKDILTNLNPE